MRSSIAGLSRRAPYPFPFKYALAQCGAFRMFDWCQLRFWASENVAGCGALTRSVEAPLSLTPPIFQLALVKPFCASCIEKCM